MAEDTENVFKYIEIRIEPDPFFTSCNIYSTNKKAKSKNTLKPKAPFNWIFMDIIPAIEPKSLTSENTIYDYF